MALTNGAIPLWCLTTFYIVGDLVDLTLLLFYLHTSVLLFSLLSHNGFVLA